MKTTSSSPTGVPIPCSEPDCVITFGRVTELKRHLDEVHGYKKFCDEPGCPYSAKRLSRVRDHKAKYHPQLYNIQLAVPQQLQHPSSNFFPQMPPNRQTQGDPHTQNATDSNNLGGGYMGLQQNYVPYPMSTWHFFVMENQDVADQSTIYQAAQGPYDQ